MHLLELGHRAAAVMARSCHCGRRSLFQDANYSRDLHYFRRGRDVADIQLLLYTGIEAAELTLFELKLTSLKHNKNQPKKTQIISTKRKFLWLIFTYRRGSNADG